MDSKINAKDNEKIEEVKDGSVGKDLHNRMLSLGISTISAFKSLESFMLATCDNAYPEGGSDFMFFVFNERSRY